MLAHQLPSGERKNGAIKRATVTLDNAITDTPRLPGGLPKRQQAEPGTSKALS